MGKNNVRNGGIAHLAFEAGGLPFCRTRGAHASVTDAKRNGWDICRRCEAKLAKMKAVSAKRNALTENEKRDIKLWFAWGSIYEYPTGPKAYLKMAMKPERKAEFLAMARPKRKAILRFVIEESNRRQKQ
jgi:hypothetical protein